MKTATKSISSPITIVKVLLLIGFRPGAPKRISEETQRIDRQCARQLHCAWCHKKGLSYSPFHRGREYRALAHCPLCEYAEEI